MNYNVVAYLIYIVLTVFIIVFVGRLFHKNGRLFILSLFSGNARLTDQVNNILLVAYYLFNIGYGFVRLQYWQEVQGTASLVSSVADNLGLLILILAATHYLNMLTIYLFSNSKIFHHQ